MRHKVAKRAVSNEVGDPSYHMEDSRTMNKGLVCNVMKGANLGFESREENSPESRNSPLRHLWFSAITSG
jgi:hypothetical protein